MAFELFDGKGDSRHKGSMYVSLGSSGHLFVGKSLVRAIGEEWVEIYFDSETRMVALKGVASKNAHSLKLTAYSFSGNGSICMISFCRSISVPLPKGKAQSYTVEKQGELYVFGPLPIHG